MKNKIIQLMAQPLVQFLVIGACIYGAYALFASPLQELDDTRVHVDAKRINALISSWEQRWKRGPTDEELDGLIQAYIKEEILYRQALSMGLNEDDPLTRRRMAQKLEFITSDLADAVQPTETDLETYFDQNQGDYQKPDLITFRHVYFSPDKRKNAVWEDAKTLLETLTTNQDSQIDLYELGDVAMFPLGFEAVSKREVARQMGGQFADAVMDLPVGQWSGPLQSGYGVHLVFVDRFEPAPPTRLEDVRQRVASDWQEMQRKNFNETFYEGLRKGYEIVIDSIPRERILVPGARGSDDLPGASETGK